MHMERADHYEHRPMNISRQTIFMGLLKAEEAKEAIVMLSVWMLLTFDRVMEHRNTIQVHAVQVSTSH